jgi:dTMP kinase
MVAHGKIRFGMTCPIPRGLLVAIEGIDGSGKTTQAELLARFCQKNNLSHVLSKEPTRGQFGQMIRDSARRGRMSIYDEIDILLKDRQEHVQNVIAPALENQQVVILDRYYFSTAAYQGTHGADSDSILATNEAFAPQPDLLIVLDIPPSLGLDRIRARGDEPNKFESVESLERARMIFNHITRPYKALIDAREGIGDVSYSVINWFLGTAVNKIAKYDFSTSGLNRTLELFGSTAIPQPA